MTLADRIVLLKDGLIEQQGTPLELFEQPATRFVAGFLGSPAMNFVPARLEADGESLLLGFDDGRSLLLPPHRRAVLESRIGKNVICGLRPEHMEKLRGGDERPGLASMLVTIDLVQPTGARVYGTFLLGGVEVVAEFEVHDIERPGESLTLLADMNRAIVIDPETNRVIR